MNLYLLVKILPILNAAVLFSSGMNIAFFLAKPI